MADTAAPAPEVWDVAYPDEQLIAQAKLVAKVLKKERKKAEYTAGLITRYQSRLAAIHAELSSRSGS